MGKLHKFTPREVSFRDPHQRKSLWRARARNGQVLAFVPNILEQFSHKLDRPLGMIDYTLCSDINAHILEYEAVVQISHSDLLKIAQIEDLPRQREMVVAAFKDVVTWFDKLVGYGTVFTVESYELLEGTVEPTLCLRLSSYNPKLAK